MQKADYPRVTSRVNEMGRPILALSKNALLNDPRSLASQILRADRSCLVGARARRGSQAMEHVGSVKWIVRAHSQGQLEIGRPFGKRGAKLTAMLGDGQVACCKDLATAARAFEFANVKLSPDGQPRGAGAVVDCATFRQIPHAFAFYDDCRSCILKRKDARSFSRTKQCCDGEPNLERVGNSRQRPHAQK